MAAAAPLFLPNRPMFDFHPAYDEVGEADGSSDDEDFDARWADEYRMLPQYSGPVTKKARAGADQAGAGMQSGGGAGFDHRGRSAQQQVIAGSGRPGAPPGYHYMSTGVMMRDPD